jgi:hypothetical protein
LLNESEITDFPILTRERLQSLTIDLYQLRQAPHYTKEHRDDDGIYQMFYATDEDMLKVKIRSRHSNSVQHTLWLRYDNTLEEPIAHEKSGHEWWDAVHVSVLWYLGYDKHQNQHTRGHEIKMDSILDASILPETDSESSEDDESPQLQEE